MHSWSCIFLGAFAVTILLLSSVSGKSFPGNSLYSVGGRVIGGRPANAGEFPYQLQIRFDGEFACGGTLVDNGGTQIAVTAGHCAIEPDRPELFELRAGILGTDEAGQAIPVKKVIVHPDYGSTDEGIPINDIAVFLIDGQFTLDDKVKTLALPTAGQVPTDQVILSGWGRTDPGSWSSATELQTAILPIVDSKQCAEWHSQSLGVSDPIKDGMFCAGYQTAEKGGCHGDSGGPAAGVEGGNPYLAGVVSWGDPSCAQNPTVFTKVSSYLDFISGASR